MQLNYNNGVINFGIKTVKYLEKDIRIFLVYNNVSREESNNFLYGEYSGEVPPNKKIIFPKVVLVLPFYRPVYLVCI